MELSQVQTNYMTVSTKRPYEKVVKRVLDVVSATLAMVLLWPVMLLLAALVRLDSKGPAFFVQKRIGKNGQPFNIYKFRTMTHNVDQTAHVKFMQAYIAPLPQELLGLNEAQLNGELMRRGLEFMWQDPGRYLRLSLSRIPIYFKFWPSAESSTFSNISRVFSFGLYLPFFLYGLFLSRHNWRRCSLIYLFGLIYSLMHILTWASIRYRLPVDAAFMPFAALAVVGLVSRLRLRRQKAGTVAPSG